MIKKDDFEYKKQKVIMENELAYGKELREKYGENYVEEANRQIQAMSEEDYDAAQRLEMQLFQRLQEAMQEGDPASEIAQEAVELHKRWLRFYWKQYTYDYHFNLAQMYIVDERFISYYDERVAKGATQFLYEAIKIYTGKSSI